MPLPTYETAELVGTIATIRTPQRFFLERYFSAAPHLSTREDIVFDEVLEDLPVMAPFVSPVVQAKPQRRHGYQMKMFRPAYVKPKHFIKPGDFIQRQAGDDLLGGTDPVTRKNAEVYRLLALQKTQIEERWEWMAAKAVVDGRITVTGEDYPTAEVDFGRDAANDIVIAPGAGQWSDAAAGIGSQLEDWSLQLLEMTGYAGTDVIMSPEVWKNFRANGEVKEHADLLRGASNVPSLQPGVAAQGVQFKGQWGEFNLFVYAGRFKEQDGTLSRAIAAGDVIMTAAPSQEDGTGGVQGIRAFGAIQDMDANLIPMDIFPKTWREQDPSGEQLMSQSAPLMIPGRPNAVIKATVQ